MDRLTDKNSIAVKAAIYLFLCFALTVFVFTSVIDLKALQVMLTCLALMLLAGWLVLPENRNYRFDIVDLLWVLSFLFILLSLRTDSNTAIYDIIIYLCGTAFIVLSKRGYCVIDGTIRLIIVVAAFYCLATLLQPMCLDLYKKTVFQLYTPFWQENLQKYLNKNMYAGLTNQVATNAGYLLYGMGAVFSTLMAGKTRFRTGLFFLLFGMIVALLLTGKRAHLLFTAVSLLLLYFVAQKGRRYRGLKIAGIVLALGVTVYAASMMIYDFGGTMHRFLEGGDDISSGRFALFQRAWNLFLEHPVFGIGWGQFRVHSVGLLSSVRSYEVHNIYLQLLCETGIFGLLAFLAAAISNYVRCFRLLRVMSAQREEYKCGDYRAIMFSFFLQNFMLIDGMLDNVLYDINFLYIYFFACFLTNAVYYKYCNSDMRAHLSDKGRRNIQYEN